MSNTPETDAAELIYDGIVASGYADVDVCRKLKRERDEAREALALATSELAEQTFKLRQQLGKAREALQKIASMAHGSADKTVCLIMLNGISRVAQAALKKEAAK